MHAGQELSRKLDPSLDYLRSLEEDCDGISVWSGAESQQAYGSTAMLGVTSPQWENSVPVTLWEGDVSAGV